MTKLRFIVALMAGLLAVALFSAVASAEDVQQGGVLVTDSLEQQATGPPAQYQQDQQVMVTTLTTAEASAVGVSTDKGIVTVTMMRAADSAGVVDAINITDASSVSNTSTDKGSYTTVIVTLVAAFLIVLAFGIANAAPSAWFLNHTRRAVRFANSLAFGLGHSIAYVTDTIITVTAAIPTALAAIDMKSIGKTGPTMSFAS